MRNWSREILIIWITKAYTTTINKDLDLKHCINSSSCFSCERQINNNPKNGTQVTKVTIMSEGNSGITTSPQFLRRPMISNTINIDTPTAEAPNSHHPIFCHE